MYVACDASQLEWRGALELSKEWVGINEIKNKDDVHSLNQVAFNLPSRLISKIYLFRTIFRGSGWGFANDPDFMHVSDSPEYWDEVGTKFYKKYHNLDKQHQVWKDLVISGQPIVGPLGREWKIVFDGLKIPWTVFTNYPVQGTCADIMVLVRVIFRKRLRKESWGDKIKLVTSVHDSVVVDCPTEYVDKVVRLFYDVFAALIPNIKTIWGYDWETPLECECKIGVNMKDMKKIVPIDKTS